MQATAKYLIHAAVRTNGVVERSDVVGAVFGQTEGLLGEQLDLRDLQESSKVGRIDVDIDSEGGRSVGTITIASGLDRVETAVLAAALETIDRVGPCRAECTITSIEDARAAKRRELVDRATELLADLEETTVTSEEIVEEVRRQARVEEITEFKGMPAGPRVASSDAIIIVEGRADVRRLLKYGIRNAVAVEGTDVPNAIAELTFDRNTTAFLDGDRGGDLILRELQQVGDVDYVAFAPTDQSVEDLDRTAILSALRRKVPLDQVTDGQTPRQAFGPSETADIEEAESETDTEVSTRRKSVGTAETETSESGEPPSEEIAAVLDNTTPTADVETASETMSRAKTDGQTANEEEISETDEATTPGETESVEDEITTTPVPDDGQHVTEGTASEQSEGEEQPEEAEQSDGTRHEEPEQPSEPQTLAGHVEAVIAAERGTVRFLSGAFETLDEVEADEAFDALEDSETTPAALVVDGTLTQRLLDIAAQRGVGQIVAQSTGEFVKQPTDIRVRTAGELEASISAE